ncbi:MAG: TolC family protein, partial [Gemmata sp.]
RLLRLDPTAVVEPAEPPSLPVAVVDANVALDDLIPVALGARPELAGNQALVRATLARLKQEKIRPLVPSLAVRSVSTNPSGSLGYGGFGGGRSGEFKNFDGRFDIDVQLLWEFSALGLGNRARVHERRAEHEIATLELFRTQDRVAAEVATAYAQVRAAAQRLSDAEPALREAVDLVQKSVDGLGQTRRVGDALTLVVRPQEAVAAIQAFAQANADFFAAVSDYNRAQFRLHRALGRPAQCLAGSALPSPQPARVGPPSTPAPEMKVPAQPGQPPSVLPTVPEPGAKPVQALPDLEWAPAAAPAQPPAPRQPPIVVPEREAEKQSEF